MTVVAFFVFGLIIGSFLNVLILRWRERPLTGRSACMSCRTELAWYDLIPVLSWVLLRGRCRSCGARISAQYALVEVATGLLFLLIGLAPLPLYLQILALPIAALLVAVTVYDLYHTIIPDPWVYSFAALALLVSFFSLTDGAEPQALVAAFAAGPGVAAPLYALWFFSKGEWMGFGDVKFALGMGWLLGFESGIVALFLAFLIGALVSVPLLFLSSPLWGRIRDAITPTSSSRKPTWGFTMKSEVPFGPFLIAATLIVWLSDMYGYALIGYLT